MKQILVKRPAPSEAVHKYLKFSNYARMPRTRDILNLLFSNEWMSSNTVAILMYNLIHNSTYNIVLID